MLEFYEFEQHIVKFKIGILRVRADVGCTEKHLRLAGRVGSIGFVGDKSFMINYN